MRKIVIIYILCTFIISGAVGTTYAKEDNSYLKDSQIDKAIYMITGAQESVLEVGLVDCIAYALKSNSEIKIKRIDPILREDDVKVAKAVFEPTFSLGYNLKDSKSISSYSSWFTPPVSTLRETDFEAGVNGKFVTGTRYELDVLGKEYKSNAAYQQMDPYYTVEPTITITQPLFKNFGIYINKADIFIAQNTALMSKEDFSYKVMGLITLTKTKYYQYIFAMENLRIARLSLERGKLLLEINKARYKKGIISSVDLLETEAAVAQREKILILAEADLKTSEDELKVVTNLIDDPQLWNAKLQLMDKPQFVVYKPDITECLKNAFSFRPDYIAKKIDLENKDIKIKLARNDLFPTVDLVGSLGLNGLGTGYGDAVDRMSSRYRDWSVGVAFNKPWGGADRAKFDQAKLEKTQALIAFTMLEHNIIFEIRDKVRDIDTAYREVLACEVSKEKEIENYEAQKERYAVGQVSTHDMLDYQDKLAQAELDYIKALIAHNITIINLEKTEGLTLVKNNVKLEE